LSKRPPAVIPLSKVHFETALNCAWLLLAAIALVSTIGVVRRGRSRAETFSAWLQLVGVASVVLALFPYISATDDLLRIANAVPQSKQSEPGQRAPAADLLRLYETADAPLVCQACRLTVTFFTVWLIVVPVKAAVTRSMPLQSGRSPPVNFASA
jgi:hypothetical protein